MLPGEHDDSFALLVLDEIGGDGEDMALVVGDGLAESPSG